MIDTKIYQAKATWPAGIQWRSPWSTKDEAEKYAKWFCQTWGTCGVFAKAAVFYRDGSLVVEHENDLQGKLDDYDCVLRHSLTKD